MQSYQKSDFLKKYIVSMNVVNNCTFEKQLDHVLNNFKPLIHFLFLQSTSWESILNVEIEGHLL